jgi:hypothetical protein
MGAGRKNADNTFSGIFLGEVGGTGGPLSGTYGLYGYNHGTQVFGFNDTGKAFIGGSGAQLMFNADTDGGLSIMTGGFEQNNIN